MKDNDLSVTIPIFNEEKNIDELYSQLNKVLSDLGITYEIIFVDDHSIDGSYAILKDIAEKDNAVKLISFKRHYGQTAAMQAGFEHASGRIIVSMDGYLQNDPADIPCMINKIKEGHDVVCGWRKDRKDRLFSRRI